MDSLQLAKLSPRSSSLSPRSSSAWTSCLFISPPLNESLKVFMQVFFVVTFLSLFFFLYVVKVEKEIFDDQINVVVDSLFNELQLSANLIVPKLVQAELKQEALAYMQTVTLESSHSYDDIRQQNDDVINTTKNVIIVFATILGACVVAIYLLRFCVSMTHHLLENMLALGAIALTEYLFLNLVTRNYIAANPNHVKFYVAQRVQSYAQKKINART